MLPDRNNTPYAVGQLMCNLSHIYIYISVQRSSPRSYLIPLAVKVTVKNFLTLVSMVHMGMTTPYGV